MKCTLTIYIMIHCQQTEIQRYFIEWIVNSGTIRIYLKIILSELDEQKHCLHIVW